MNSKCLNAKHRISLSGLRQEINGRRLTPNDHLTKLKLRADGRCEYTKYTNRYPYFKTFYAGAKCKSCCSRLGYCGNSKKHCCGDECRNYKTPWIERGHCDSPDKWSLNFCGEFIQSLEDERVVDLRFGCTYSWKSARSYCWRQKSPGSSDWCWGKVNGSFVKCKGEDILCAYTDLLC